MQLHHNYGRPDVERLARAICVERGYDPDMLRPDSGYPDAVQIPLWWTKQDEAISFIAMMKAWKELK